MATRAAKGESVTTPYRWGLEPMEMAKAGLSEHELFREIM